MLNGPEAVPVLDTASRLPRLFRVGYVLDRLLCVILFGGDGTETMSHLIARKRAGGARWACVGCWLLAVIVERHHCSKTLAVGDTNTGAMWRAGLAMVAGLIAVAMLAHLVVRVVLRLF